MIAIQKSRLFILIALLACLLCVPYVIASVLATVALVLGIVASIVTIIIGIIALVKWVQGIIRDLNDTLEGLKDQEKQVQDQLEGNSEEEEDLTRLIDRYSTLLEQAEDNLYAAIDAVKSTEKVYNAAKAKVTKKSDAYKQAKKAYDDHEDDCYYCQTNQFCSIGSQLSYKKSQAQEELRKAKVSRTFAKSDFNKAKSEKRKWANYVLRYSGKLHNLREDHTDILEETVRLLKKQTDLNTQIGERDTDLLNAKDYLRKLNSAKSYAESLRTARDAGNDMEQWVRDNPPPKDFIDYLNGMVTLE